MEKKITQDFHYLDKKPLTLGCLYTLWEVPIARICKMLWGKLIFEVPDSHLFWGVWRAWMTFKQPEMEETLDMRAFIYLMGSPDCEDFKNAMEEGNFRGT